MNELFKDNSCDIYKYIENIQGLASDSISPSDTIIVKFKDGLLYDNKKVEYGFMKLFISHVKDIDIDPTKKRTALLYEQKVYELINLCIRSNYCPYFVKNYANGFDCNFSQILKILSTKFDEKLADELLTRSSLYMFGLVNNRPSITDTENLSKQDEKVNLFIKLDDSFLSSLSSK